jgi:glycosyltransferase involved in cell wall biosynthesis
MALGLEAAGAKVKILAMSTPKHNSNAQDFPNTILNKIEVQDVFVDTSISVGNAIKNLLFSRLPYNAERFISSNFQMELTLVLKDKYDVVQLEGPYLFPYIDTINKFHQGIISYRAHNVEWEIWQRNAAMQPNPLYKIYFKVISKRLREFETQLLSQIDVLVPITKRDELILTQMRFSGKSFVAQTGFEETSTKRVFASMEYPSVFHIGGLDWLPNREGIIWFLKNCWPKIQAIMPNLKFYIAGRNAPKKFIKFVSGQKNVVFCGEVEDSATFMLSKALMVVPLLSGSGMRIKVVEGLARKRAIVSTSIGVEGLDLTDGVEVAIADNPENFSNKVIEILTNRSMFDKLVNAGKQYVDNKLNNNRITSELLGFYMNLG